MVNRSAATPLHGTDLLQSPLSPTRKQSLESTTTASSDQSNGCSKSSKGRGFPRLSFAKLTRKSSLKKKTKTGNRIRKVLKSNRSVCEPVSIDHIESPFDILTALLNEIDQNDVCPFPPPTSMASSVSVSASSSCSLEKESRPSVRFREVAPEDIIPSDLDLTPGDIAQSWWQPEDYANMSGVAWALADEFPTERQRQFQDFLKVVQYCVQHAPSRSSHNETRTRVQENLSIFESDPEDLTSLESSLSSPSDSKNKMVSLDVDPKYLVPSLTRGVELVMTPQLRELRSKHTNAVLQCYRKGSPKHLHNTLHHQRRVAMQSLKFSRPSKVLARILGEADANAV